MEQLLSLLKFIAIIILDEDYRDIPGATIILIEDYRDISGATAFLAEVYRDIPGATIILTEVYRGNPGEIIILAEVYCDIPKTINANPGLILQTMSQKLPSVFYPIFFFDILKFIFAIIMSC
jgi:hypothetical protein